MPNPFVPVALPSYAELRERLVKATRGAGFPVQTPQPPPPETAEGEPIPEPYDPIAEGRQAYLPYRGTEMHGVASPDPTVFEDAEGYGPGTVPVVYDETPKGGTVIDVRLVSDSAEQLAAWRVNQFTAPAAGNPPANIASRQRNRTKLQIKNLATVDGVWIGPSAELSAFNGWLLKAGEEVTLSSTETVYALANGANIVPVALLTEFTQEA
jgi:hypothetical protein